MRTLLKFSLLVMTALVLPLTAPFQANAARELAPVVGTANTQEIVVFEAENCTYCSAFRSQIPPNYRQSPRAGELPIRFVDVNATGVDRMKLIAPIQMVPTVVMMKNGQEVDRIQGYTGPDLFHQLVTKMLQAE
jgi:thioredoxin-like negative regulator of GroEL